jgi:hypothetical protein
MLPLLFFLPFPLLQLQLLKLLLLLRPLSKATNNIHNCMYAYM